jgi:hypothetical protein
MFAGLDVRDQAGPTAQGRQLQGQRPAQPFAVEAADARGQDFESAGPRERDQVGGWLVASAAGSVSAARRAARQVSKGSGAGVASNSSV